MPDDTTIAEVFARDPLAYTEQDVPAIIAKMREARKNFNLGIKAPKAAKAVDLKELGLL